MYTRAIYDIQELQFVMNQLVDRKVSFSFNPGVSTTISVWYIDVAEWHTVLLNDLMKQAFDLR